MTTSVTIDAHAGWPVKVSAISIDGEGKEVTRYETTVPAHGKQVFAVHSHMELHIKEMPMEKPADAG